MDDQIREISERLKDLREICDLTVEEMAQKMEMSVEDYASHESGDADFPISFLCKAAEILGIDMVDLMSGDSPKLSSCTVVRKGKGFAVKRNAAYDYKHLAYTFRNKKAEPFLVTVEPNDKTPVLNSHEGQEFDYVISGKMVFYIGDVSYELSKGDSVYFDSLTPHAEKAIGDKPAQFIAVVIKQ